MRKEAVILGINGAKNKQASSPSKQKPAAKAKIAPPSATYTTTQATIISMDAVCRTA